MHEISASVSVKNFLEKFFADEEKLLGNIIISTGLPYKYMKSEFDIYYNIYYILKLWHVLLFCSKKNN